MQHQSIELAKIPQPDIVQALDYDTVLAELVAEYKSKDPSWTAEVLDDPVLAVLHVAAYLKIGRRGELNDAAKAVMIAHASDKDLENLAAIFNLKREIVIAATDDGEAVYEDDTRLRKRVLLAPEGYTNAGSRGAYIFWALTHNSVKDAYVVNTGGGNLTIVLLGFVGDGAVDAQTVSEVAAILNDDSMRPLTDNLTVQSAQIINFTHDAVLKVYAGVSAQEVLSAALAGLHKYLNENQLISADMTWSGLNAAQKVEGVERVVMNFNDLAITNLQAAYCAPEDINVTWELYDA